MNEASQCPSRDVLRDLLDDRLGDGEQAALGAHLEACDACCAAFDRLAAESRVWNVARALGDSNADPDTQAHFALDGISDSEGESTQCDHPAGMPFLQASDNPENLGNFANYEAIELIGRGGFGVVFKAFDPNLHRVVALKVLAPQLAASNAARRRFVREARAAASVAHEHVVTIHSVDEWNGWPHLVMQYVGGKSLQDRIERTGPLEVKEILRIGMQTAAGLAAAHAQGLVHRDIKPANILLENGVERVKLTDFGLARAVDDPSLTQAGTVAGTPQYMSPEQAKGDPIDPRADLFSLGCVMYAMATGAPPFQGSTTMSVLRKVCDEAPPSIRASNSDIPLWLEHVIMKLLAKEPNHRFQTAGEVSELLADYLSRVQQGLPIGAEPFDVDLDGDPRTERDHAAALAAHFDVGPAKHVVRKRFKRWHVAAGLAAIALIGIGVTDSMGVTQVADTIATVLRIKTAEGTLVVEVDDPDVQVSIDDGNVVISGGGTKEVKLSAGQHQLQTIRDGEPGPIEMVTVSRGGKKTWSASFEPNGQRVIATEVFANESPDRVASLRSLYEKCGQALIEATARADGLKEEYEAAVARRLPAVDLARAKHDVQERVQALHKVGTATLSEVLAARATFLECDAQRMQMENTQSALAQKVGAASSEVEYGRARQNLVRRLLGTASRGRVPGPDELARDRALVEGLFEKRRQLELSAATIEREGAIQTILLKQQLVDLANEQVKLIKNQHDVGVASISEVAEKEAAVAKARGALVEAEIAAKQAVARLEEAQSQFDAMRREIDRELGQICDVSTAEGRTLNRDGRVIVLGDGSRAESTEAIEAEIAKLEANLKQARDTVRNPSRDPFVRETTRRLADLRARLQEARQAGEHDGHAEEKPAESISAPRPTTEPGGQYSSPFGARTEEMKAQFIRSQISGTRGMIEALRSRDSNAQMEKQIESLERQLKAFQKSLEGIEGAPEKSDENEAPTAPPALPEVPPTPTVPPVDAVAPPPPHDPNRVSDDMTWVEQNVGGVKWYWTERAAQTIAQKTRQPILVEFWADTPECAPMLAIREAPEVNERLNKFVCVRLFLDRLPISEDMVSKSENQRLAAINRGRAIELVESENAPNYAVLHPDGKRVLARCGGAENAQIFAQFLDEGAKASAAQPAGGDGAALPTTEPRRLNYAETADGQPKPESAFMVFDTHKKIKWYLNAEYARALAKEQNRPLLLGFTGVNCANCRNMEVAVLSTSEAADALDDYVCAWLYTDYVPAEGISRVESEKRAQANLELEDNLVRQATAPLFVVQDPQGKVVLSQGYELDPKKFAEALRRSVALGGEARVEKGEGSPELAALQKTIASIGRNVETARQVMQQHIKTVASKPMELRTDARRAAKCN